jgi:hypothetical protein
MTALHSIAGAVIGTIISYLGGVIIIGIPLGMLAVTTGIDAIGLTGGALAILAGLAGLVRGAFWGAHWIRIS